MSQHYGDYEDFLRGALHAAVDSVEPAGDGLERIRGRLAPPHPLPVAHPVFGSTHLSPPPLDGKPVLTLPA